MERRSHKRRFGYWSALAGICVLFGAWAYYRGTRSYIDCVDGHCPDADSPEYFMGVRSMNEAAPFTAIEVMIVVAAVGILARAIYLIIRRVLWTLAP
ncbi:hypothetical protein DM806_16745 [Sphingobium lactosutens]|nr:hypothetical protein [Sphingobium lactosutens]